MNDKTLPPQHQQRQPGVEHTMHPEPIYLADDYRAAGFNIDRLRSIITKGVFCVYFDYGLEVFFFHVL